MDALVLIGSFTVLCLIGMQVLGPYSTVEGRLQWLEENG